MENPVKIDDLGIPLFWKHLHTVDVRGEKFWDDFALNKKQFQMFQSLEMLFYNQ